MIETFIHIKDGHIANPKALKQAFQLTDGRYKVTIKRANKRSLMQNAYYWGVVVPLVKEGLRDMGYDEVKTNNDAHEVLKSLFVKKSIASAKGDDLVIVGSSADLTTTEFMSFMDEVYRWAIDYLGITIPAPNEQSTINFQDA